MRIHDLRVAHSNDGVEISACVDAERVVLRTDVTDPLVATGDSFLAIALIRAMERGEVLRVAPEVPISRRLLVALTAYQEIYATWWPHLHVVDIDAPGAIDSPAAGKRVGCFFSGGIDSVFSVVRHLDRIDDLILCRGLDIAPDEAERWALTVELVRTFATSVGKRLVCIDTDAKQRFRNYRSSNYGALLISTALPLGYGQLIVPSSHLSYTDLMPWGTHPLTDPMLSTGTTDVIHDGVTSRTGKTKFLVDSGIGLDSLRVCNRYSLYNCGACEKCLRTMSALAILGAGSRMLPPYDPRVLRTLRLEDATQAGFWQEILELAQSRNQHQHASAISDLLAQYHRREALRSVDQRLLGGAGVRLLRRIRGMPGRSQEDAWSRA